MIRVSEVSFSGFVISLPFFYPLPVYTLTHVNSNIPNRNDSTQLCMCTTASAIGTSSD